MNKLLKYSKNWYLAYLLLILIFFISLLFSNYLLNPVLPIKIYSFLFLILWMMNLFGQFTKALDIQSYWRKNFKSKNNNKDVTLFGVAFLPDSKDEKLKEMLLVYKSRLLLMVILFLSFPVSIILYMVALKFIV